MSVRSEAEPFSVDADEAGRAAVLVVRGQTVQYLDDLIAATERLQTLHESKGEGFAASIDQARIRAWHGVREWLTGEHLVVDSAHGD